MEEAASAAFSVSRFSRKNARDETIACAVTWPTSKPECRAPRFTSQAGRKSRQVHRFSGRCPRSPHNRMALWGRKVSSNRDSAFRNQAYSRDQDAGSSLGKLKSEPAMRSARRSKLVPPNTAAAFAAKEVAGLSRLVTASQACRHTAVKPSTTPGWRTSSRPQDSSCIGAPRRRGGHAKL
jgi:hypothetical protein